MATAHPRRSGAQVLIDQLRIHGTDTIFGVPGESYLAALDALYAQRNSIRYVICRQEGGASYMAEAYGKLTGKPASVSSRAGLAPPMPASECIPASRIRHP